MKSLDSKLIIYDSNCKICSSLRKVVLKLSSIKEEKIIAFSALPPDQTDKVDAAQFKNGIAVIDTHCGKTLYGTESIAYIFSSQYKLLDLLLKVPACYSLFSFIYQTLAYNRYLVATPKSTIKCDCLPDVNIKFRLAYIAISVCISVLITILLGLSLRPFVGAIYVKNEAVKLLLIAGTGWLLQVILAVLFLKEKALDYVGHLCTIMLAGVFIQVPWILFYFCSGLQIIWLPVLSLICSSAYMLYLHISRVRYLEISRRWTLSWFLLLQSSLLFLIYFYYLLKN
jgi:predicted DCC family thiol-disulfide oxidoreductase YuxK